MGIWLSWQPAIELIIVLTVIVLFFDLADKFCSVHCGNPTTATKPINICLNQDLMSVVWESAKTTKYY